jgi:hypothetical protein
MARAFLWCASRGISYHLAPHHNPRLRSTELILMANLKRKLLYGCAYEPEVLVERGRSFIQRLNHDRAGRRERIRHQRTTEGF